jgi:hypothetical protein
VADGVITISGDRKMERTDESDNVIRVESFHGTFTRSFVLPDDIDAKGIQAEAKDGVLRIRVPKTKTKKAEPMAIEVHLITATVTNPLFLAGVVIVAGFVGTRYWQPRSSLAYFAIQLAGFVTGRGLLLVGGVVPYRPGVGSSERMRLSVSDLEIIWWLGGAWLTVGFLRAFVVLGRQPRESKLVQDLLAGLVYLAATVAIIAYQNRPLSRHFL